jgi:hypothetical protein
MKIHGFIALAIVTLAFAQEPKAGPRQGKHEHLPNLKKACDCPTPVCPVFLNAKSVSSLSQGSDAHHADRVSPAMRMP